MQKKNNSFGIASLVCGVVGILLPIMPYFGLPMSVLALVFAGKQNKTNPNGLATSGKVTGIVGVVLNGITLIILGFVFLFALGMSSV